MGGQSDARVAEHPRPDHVIAHISDTHLIAGDGDDLYGDVDADARLSELLERLENSPTRPDALIFTGDLADTGQPEAYRKLRERVEPLADRLGAELIWVIGDHDDRAALREHLSRDLDHGADGPGARCRRFARDRLGYLGSRPPPSGCYAGAAAVARGTARRSRPVRHHPRDAPPADSQRAGPRGTGGAPPNQPDSPRC